MIVANLSTPGLCLPSTEIQITAGVLKRFWGKVTKTEGCWEWAASSSRGGYGAFGVGKKVLRATRVSYAIHFGNFPSQLDVCHTCDNPCCVRPDHLFLGTHTENMQDMVKKGRYSEEKRNPKRKRGVEFWSAKLDPHKVLAIRREYIPGVVSQRFLAKKYGVTKNAVALLLSGVTWKHLLPTP